MIRGWNNFSDFMKNRPGLIPNIFQTLWEQFAWPAAKYPLKKFYVDHNRDFKQNAIISFLKTVFTGRLRQSISFCVGH